MIQKVFYGTTNTLTEKAYDLHGNERFALGVIVLLIVVFGVYPQPLLNLTNGFVDGLLNKINVSHLFVVK
jgi:NADH-quinone oxidoreductase subunit M